MTAGFAAALLDPGLPTPHGLVNPDGRPAVKRFNVYRNNVAIGLTDALELSFPVIRQLVGPAFFRAMAGMFLRAHPPHDPLMMYYGTAMPAFLAGFPPVQHLPYLPDIARLELAIRHAYHAADAEPIDTAVLAAMPPEMLQAATVRFAPPVQLVRSDWPIHAIWRAHSEPDAPKPGACGEAVLITRPGFDPALHLIGPAAAQTIAAALAGATLGASISAAATDPDFAAVFALLLNQGAISALN